ncbi:MAG: esterase/lipase family protein [Gammaproteobacteria bacterium]
MSVVRIPEFILGVILTGLLLTGCSVFSPSVEAASNERVNECVILLHGLWRSNDSMQNMETALHQAGYVAINVDYSSMAAEIPELAEALIPRAVAQCQTQGSDRIHFVAHSMGGILLRYYLGHQKIAGLGRVVMLSPPNKGSEVVDALGGFPGFNSLAGPSGRQLGTGAGDLPASLGPANFELGIITGDRSVNPVFSILLPGDDDGSVTVESAKLEGMADFLVVPHSHSFIMQRDVTITQTVYFLRNGEFDHSDKSAAPTTE